jgi:hypothetical protein
MKFPVSPVALGAGLLAVAAGVGSVLWMQRGAHVELRGSVLKVRTHPMDEASSIAIIDFRFANPADYPFVVRSVEVSFEDAEGAKITGTTVSELDARRLFEYYPVLGQKFNDSLVLRTRIGARLTMDRMIVARFETPEAKLQARRKLTVRIEDVDGPVSELVENR